MGQHRSVNLRLSYLAFVSLGAVVSHLVSEFAAMGHEADAVVVSPRHWYLALAAIAALAILIWQTRLLLRSAGDARAMKGLLNTATSSLPFRGRGLKFFLLAVGLQFSIASVTEIGEGCPFCGHDVVAGALGALVSVLILALAMRWIGRRVPALLGALANLVARAGGIPSQLSAPRLELPLTSQDIWFALLFNRPPPSLQLPQPT